MLTEDLVEKLTPEKSDDNESESQRIKVLEAIATVCMNQRLYHLATKKYTQAGNRMKVRVTGWMGLSDSLYLANFRLKWLFNKKNMYCT